MSHTEGATLTTIAFNPAYPVDTSHNSEFNHQSHEVRPKGWSFPALRGATAVQLDYHGLASSLRPRTDCFIMLSIWETSSNTIYHDNDDTYHCGTTWI